MRNQENLISGNKHGQKKSGGTEKRRALPSHTKNIIHVKNDPKNKNIGENDTIRLQPHLCLDIYDRGKQTEKAT